MTCIVKSIVLDVNIYVGAYMRDVITRIYWMTYCVNEGLCIGECACIGFGVGCEVRE